MSHKMGEELRLHAVETGRKARGSEQKERGALLGPATSVRGAGESCAPGWRATTAGLRVGHGQRGAHAGSEVVVHLAVHVPPPRLLQRDIRLLRHRGHQLHRLVGGRLASQHLHREGREQQAAGPEQQAER